MTNSLQSQSLTKLGVVTSAIEVNLNAKEQIETVLSAASEAVIVSHECLQGKVSISGRCNIRLLLVGEENRVISSNHNADFYDKMDNESLNASSNLMFNAVVTDIKCQLNGNVVKGSLVIEITVYMVTPLNIELTMDDKLCVKKSTIETSTLNASIDNTFSVSSEQQVDTNILRVISADSVACLNSTSTKDQILTVNGHIYTNFVYMASENKILVKQIVQQFTEEIKCPDLINDTTLSVSISVRSTKVHIDVMEDTESNTYSLDISLNCKATQMTPTVRDVVSDAYSITNETTLTYNSVECCLCNDIIYHTCQVEGTIDYDEVNTVIGFVNNKAQIINCVATDGIMVLDGIISGNIIATSDDAKTTAHQYQIPMSIRLEKGINANHIMPTAIISEVKNHISNGKMQITCTVMFNINSYCINVNSLVSQVKLLDAKLSNRSAIEVCMARKGDTLWDIAKGLSVTEDIVTTYNPELVLPLEKEEKVVLYRQIN